MDEKIKHLLEERTKLADKLKALMDDYQEVDNDNEDTWGGHDGPQAMQMENEKYLFDEAIYEIDQELKKLGYKEKVG